MRRRVRAVGVVVAPLPVLSDDAAERALEVVDEIGVDVLVDRHLPRSCAGRRRAPPSSLLRCS
jgi:hypothetical protein